MLLDTAKDRQCSANSCLHHVSPDRGPGTAAEDWRAQCRAGRAVILRRDPEHWKKGMLCNAEEILPMPFAAKDSLGCQTDQKATKSTHPQPLSPNQDRDNPSKIPVNQLTRIAVFPSQGSSWLNNSLYPSISLHHLSPSFKSTQYFLNPQVLTGLKKKKNPRRKVLVTH